MSEVASAAVRPEWWQRAGSSLRTLIGAHPVAARRVRAAIVIAYLLAIVVAIVNFIAVPAAIQSAGWFATMMLTVAMLFWLARTKTIGWRMLAGVFSASLLLAPLIGFASVTASELGGGGVYDGGASSAIASHFEEAGKLIPLAVLAIAAPRRVRRFAAVDWILVGFACGAGFEAVEEAARAIAYTQPGIGNIMEVIMGDTHAPVLLFPFWTSVLESGIAASAGHAVWSGLIAGGIGLGIQVWRHFRRSPRRWLGVLLPVVAAFWALSDHMLYNTVPSQGFWDVWTYEGVPLGSTAFWFVTGRGYLTGLALFAVFVAALASDVARRSRAAELDPSARVYSPIVAERTARARDRARGAGPVRGVLGSLAVAGIQWAGDVTPVLRAYRRRRGERARSAVLRGRIALSTLQEARRYAMRITTPSRSDAGFRALAIVTTVVGLAVAVVIGIWVASAIGLRPEISGDSRPLWDFLGGLFGKVQDWWNDLSPAQQFGVTVLGAGLLFVAGAPLATSLLWSGIGSYSLAHAGDLEQLARDPRGSIKEYLLHRTPGDMLADGIELGLTVLPIPAAKTPAGEIQTFLGGEAISYSSDELRGQGSSWAERHPSIREQIARNDASLGAEPYGSPAEGEVLRIPSGGKAIPLTAEPGQPVVGTEALKPGSSYEVPGRGTYYTDGTGDVSWVVEDRGGSIEAELAHPRPGVIYVENDGVAYLQRADGGLWAVRVTLP